MQFDWRKQESNLYASFWDEKAVFSALPSEFQFFFMVHFAFVIDQSLKSWNVKSTWINISDILRHIDHYCIPITGYVVNCGKKKASQRLSERKLFFFFFQTRIKKKTPFWSPVQSFPFPPQVKKKKNVA